MKIEGQIILSSDQIKRLFGTVFLLLSLFFPFSFCLAQTGNRPPNILWIVTEDMSPLLACYGDSTVATPNIDLLAKESVVYDHCYSVSGVCAPSRSALITGLYPTNYGAQHMRNWKKGALKESRLDSTLREKCNKVPLYEAVPPPDAKCFTEFLRMNGYFCSNSNKTDYQFEAPFTAWDDMSSGFHWRKRPAGKPFFSVINIFDTHESKLWERQNQPILADTHRIKLPPYYPDHPKIKADFARLYSNVMEMDKAVGKILKALDEDSLKDSTIIVFFSDHGDGLPRSKRWPYDSGIRVPLLIRYPDRQPCRDSTLISFVDFAPTILSLAGIKPGSHFHGRAFAGKYSDNQERKYIYAARDRHECDFDRVRAVRNKRFKYIRNYFPSQPYIMPLAYRDQLGTMKAIYSIKDTLKNKPEFNFWVSQSRPEEELYDTWNDPFELKNLAGLDAYKATLIQFRKALANWQTEFPDLSEKEESQMVSELHPGGKQQKTQIPEVKMEGKEIRITCKTKGASIGWRKLNSNEPWKIYFKPIKILEEDIEIRANRIGFKSSETVIFKAKF